ncbi:hypothetical protein AGMMS49992_33220 [Clostridia bacterium]|nr:hypothetical protein AGMMS49992_33220 [Clostridia bacterium]
MADTKRQVSRPNNYYASLEITNGVMFSTTMEQRPERVTDLLREMFPDEQIGNVTPSDPTADPAVYINGEQTFSPVVYAHGVRYDVFHTDGRLLFDVEMHNLNKWNDKVTAIDFKRLIKRTRYAHSVMDITSFPKNEDYINLKRHYVVYIRTFDLLGESGYRYEPIIPWFEGYPNILFDEDRRTIFFNTKGNKGEIAPRMKEILKYMNDPKTYPVSKTDVAWIQEVDAAVKFNRQNPEWRRNYEMLAMYVNDAVIEAKQEGRQEERKLSAIVIKLLNNGHTPIEISKSKQIPLDDVLAIQKEYEED